MSPRSRHVPPAGWLLAAVFVPLVAPIARGQVTETGVTLAWTAPGDDSLTGRATRYDLRWSPAPITTLGEFGQATPVAGVASPRAAGSAESAAVTGLTPETTYWFALRTFDEVGNGSDLSNVIQVTTLSSSDVERPAPITLSLVSATGSSVTLSWTDVGDDSLTGIASAVEIRWSTAPITEAGWSSAVAVFGEPAPGPPGTPQQLTVTGLDRTLDLWFAARARDEVNRRSGVSSSLAVAHALDTAPPATPTGLGATVEGARSVRVRWSPNSEPDLAGYRVYRALDPAGPFQPLTGSPVPTSDYLDGTPPDTLAVWYGVSAEDASGNESARTAPLRVFLRGAGIAAWSASTPYPNPSPVGTDVTMPLEVPPTGPFDATVEIQDAAGQHVRTLRIAGASPGSTTLRWDGRNDAGRACAPGVYRAWLKAGDRRQLVRFVRTP